MAHAPHQPHDYAAPHPESDSPEHHGVGHVVSPKILFATGFALLVLTVVTVLAAQVDFEAFDLKELNIFVALGIAAVKATLVCLFFMHLRWDRPFNSFVLVASIGFVALFISFAMTDTSEYQEEMLPGEAKNVAPLVEAIPPAPAAPAPEPDAADADAHH